MTPPDAGLVFWRLERAEGFLLLGMTAAARRELELLPPEAMDLVRVRATHLELALAERDWTRVAALAVQLRLETPEQVQFWIWEAYGRRRAEGLESARAVLAAARPQFPEVALIPYNLGCYDCVDGRLDSARAHLRAAFGLDPGLLEQAAEDEDLAALADELDALGPAAD